LTFTLAKRAAIQLYEKLGFHTVKSFNAVVWPADIDVAAAILR